MTLKTRKIVLSLACLSVLFCAALLPAVACPTLPTAGSGTTMDLGARWVSDGVSDLRSGNYLCAQNDFAHAAAFLHRQLTEPSGEIENRYDLAFALSQEAVALSKLGQRTRAAQDWREAAKLIVGPMFPESEKTSTSHADALFARHQYRAAFEAYRGLIFFPNGGGGLDPTEWDSGAAAAIRHGLDLAVRGQYAAALRILSKSPASQAARFLEGQLASIVGNYRLAYDAYVDEQLAYLDLPAQPGAATYGTIFDRASWLRLVELIED